MKKRNFIKKASAITLSLAMLTSSITFAHSGRTDSAGGHRDNKNVSGLGSYHYHCGGNPAHLHKNGVCPYSQSKPASSKPVTNNSTTSKPSTSKPSSTQTNKVYATVPSFPVKISGVDVNNSKAEYPPLFLNNIAYIPLTYDVLTHLDLDYTWDNPANLIFNRKAVTNNEKQFNQLFNNGYSAYGYSAQIVKVNKGIIANGSTVSSEYPIINYKNINYLPLTWELTQSLGLEGTWTPYAGIDLNLK